MESHFQNNDRELLVKLVSDAEYMKSSINEIKTSIANQATINKESYVTKDEFSPVRNLVYGLVALTLTSVGGAIIALVLKR